MTERWVCKRCFADNDETNSACQRCGLIRGAEATDADQARPADGGWRRWLRYWWIPAIVVALAVGYFTNARRGADGGITDGGTLQIADLRVGDCFDLTEATATEISEVDAKPCTDAHEYEMFHITTWTGAGARRTRPTTSGSPSSCRTAPPASRTSSGATTRRRNSTSCPSRRPKRDGAMVTAWCSAPWSIHSTPS